MQKAVGEMVSEIAEWGYLTPYLPLQLFGLSQESSLLFPHLEKGNTMEPKLACFSFMRCMEDEMQCLALPELTLTEVMLPPFTFCVI